MFQFPRFPSPKVCVPKGDGRAPAAGFAHSETPGSKAVCASPGTIAACRVLRRLPVPRHPPCARDISRRPAPGRRRHVLAFKSSWMCRMNSARSRGPLGAPGVAYHSSIRCDPTLCIQVWVFDASSFSTRLISMENRVRARMCLLALLALCGSQGTRVRPRGPDAAGDAGDGPGRARGRAFEPKY